MKNFIFIFFFSFSIIPQYSFGITPDFTLNPGSKLPEKCLKTSQLAKKSVTCFNIEKPLKSFGFYFGCSRMLQYSIVKKKDGRIKKLSQRLVYDTDRIYFRPAYNEDKYYINRKTLELNTPTGRSIGQCKVLTNPDNIKEELELILKSNTSNNLL